MGARTMEYPVVDRVFLRCIGIFYDICRTLKDYRSACTIHANLTDLWTVESGNTVVIKESTLRKHAIYLDFDYHKCILDGNPEDTTGLSKMHQIEHKRKPKIQLKISSM